MKSKGIYLSRFLTWSSKTAGKPITFVFALFILIIWLIGGIFWGFTDNWLLIINTIATINASLMVFIIQSTQNRESKALHIKIDELIRSQKEAENEIMAIEEMEEEELEKIRKKIFQKSQKPPSENKSS